MSLLNVYVAAHRALVGVDTACGAIPGDPVAEWMARSAPGQSLPAHVSKVFPIAHLGAVLAARGTHTFLMDVVGPAAACASVDELEDVLPKILEAADQAHANRCRHFGLPDQVTHAAQELLLVGWSAREGGMIATIYEREAGPSQAFTVDQVEAWAAPWETSYGQAIEPRTDHDMLQLARAQVSHSRRDHPGAPIGGRLIVAEVTREAIAIRQAGELG